MSILYEVTLHIEPSLIDEYDTWLRAHVEQMLALPGFDGATVHAIVSDNSEDPESIGRVVHYKLTNRQAFDDYERDHAERMRHEGLRRFGNRVRASRRILVSK